MSTNNPEYIVIGTVMAPWGIEGYLKVKVETDFPQRFSASSEVYIDGRSMIIESVAWHKGRAIVKLEGLDSESEARKLTGSFIEIHRSQLYALQEDEYFHFQLVGLKVQTVGGEIVGEVADILSMSSADVYVVKGPDGEILIPAIDDVVKSVDMEAGVITIEPVDGLLNLNEKKPRQKKL